MRLGRYPEASAAFTTAREAFTAAGNDEEVAACDANLGNMAYMQGRFAEAAERYERAYAVFEKLNDDARMASTLHGMGNACLHAERLLAGAPATTPAPSAIYQRTKDKYGEANALQAMALVHKELGDYGAAADVWRRTLALTEAGGDRAGTAKAYAGLGEIYRLQGDLARALEHQLKALADLGAVEERRRVGRGALRRRPDLRPAAQLPARARVVREGPRPRPLHQGRREAVRDGPGARTRRHGGRALRDGSTRRRARRVRAQPRAAREAEGRGRRDVDARPHGRAARVAAAARGGVQGVRAEPGDCRGAARPERRLDGARAPRAARVRPGPRRGRAGVGGAGDGHRAGNRALRHGDVREGRHRPRAAEGRPGPTRRARRTKTRWRPLAQVPVGPAAETFFDNRRAPFVALVDLFASQGKADEAFRWSERGRLEALAEMLGGDGAVVVKDLTAAERDQERRCRRTCGRSAAQVRRERGRAKPDADRLAALQQELAAKQAERDALRTDPLREAPGAAAPAGPGRAGGPRRRRGRVRHGARRSWSRSSSPRRAPGCSRVATDAGHGRLGRAEGAADRGEGGRARGEGQAVPRSDRAEGRSAWRSWGANSTCGSSTRSSRCSAKKTRLLVLPDGFLWSLPFEALQTTAGSFLVEDMAVSYLPSLTALPAAGRRGAGRWRCARHLVTFGQPVIGPALEERLALIRPSAPAQKRRPRRRRAATPARRHRGRSAPAGRGTSPARSRGAGVLRAFRAGQPQGPRRRPGARPIASRPASRRARCCTWPCRSC